MAPPLTHPAIQNLRDNQRQLDADGCEVGVSRQALEETLALLDETRQDALNAAWRAVDACGGADSHPEYDRALSEVCAALERLGARDPDPEVAKLRQERAELLAAAKALDAHWTEDVPHGPGEEGEPRLFAPDTLAVWRQIRAAIAKAEGR